jgi:Phosphate-selective porin O and P.
LFSSLVRDGLKGSGDYGVFAFGAYNGQTANKPEQNNNRHLVTRITYPFELANGQIFEPGIQAYSGMFVVAKDQLTRGTKAREDRNYRDERIAATLQWYPKPFGVLAEFNVGRGPEFNPATDSIETRRLMGGYATFSYMLKKGDQTIIPFARAQFYDGGKKHELDARSYSVREVEIGIEWQPMKQFELVAMYTISSRRFEDFTQQDNLQQGRLLRLQAQVNF